MRNPYNWYRVARALATWRVPLLPTLIDYLVRAVFSCWLPHTAKIGRNLELGYGGLGCVVHGDCIIGDDVHIGTGVVLGGSAREVGQPVIGSSVYIGTGAKLLGPIHIGDSAVVGANAVVLKDVPANVTVVGVPARTVSK